MKNNKIIEKPHNNINNFRDNIFNDCFYKFLIGVLIVLLDFFLC